MPGEPKSYARRLRATLDRAKARRAAEEAQNQPPPATGEDDSFAARLKDKLEKVRPESGSTTSATNGDAAEAGKEERPDSLGPVGAGDHVVREGDCIASIAYDAGHLWTTLWDEPANSELRETRKDPNVLLPGDRVTGPPIREKQESGESETRNRYVKKGRPEVFQVRLLRDGEPRGNEPYTLVVDDKHKYEGTTDPQGQLRAAIVPNARRVVVSVGKNEPRDDFEFELGHLDPISEISGVQGRLKNLGFDCGPIDGKLNDDTRTALRQFQKARRLEVTGEPDEPTRKNLQEEYGC